MDAGALPAGGKRAQHFIQRKETVKKRRASCRHTGETRRRTTAPLPPGSLLYVFVTLSVWLLGDLRDVPSEIPRLRKRPRAAVADRALLPFVPRGQAVTSSGGRRWFLSRRLSSRASAVIRTTGNQGRNPDRARSDAHLQPNGTFPSRLRVHILEGCPPVLR